MLAPQPLQRITFHPFGNRSLAALLKLNPSRAGALRQLEYIQSYLTKLGTACVIVEQHYVDRDHMEDHSVFYSRNLVPLPNHCRRIHFFKSTPRETRRDLRGLLETSARRETDEHRADCLAYSRSNYLGFSVIRPLAGSPIGRTVIACYGNESGDGSRRRFDCARDYRVHLMGVTLTIRGLAFQQQDVGVSACATTALWSALSKVRDFEELGSATPVQITTLASRHSLPFGRPIPSEGLSVDQMCQAVQAVGVTPELLTLKNRGRPNAAAARAYLYSATASGLAPVLILARGGNAHAVTVVGMKVRNRYQAALVVSRTYDRANDLEAVYVHDDRNGPGVLAEIRPRNNVLTLRLRVFHEEGVKTEWETWTLTHILLPLHGKIRLSFLALQDLSIDVATHAHTARDFFVDPAAASTHDRNLTIDNWITRSTTYIDQLLTQAPRADINRVLRLARRVALPRYVGIIRVTASSRMDPLDVLVDTTSTARNPNIIGVFPLSATEAETTLVAEWSAAKLNCDVIAPAALMRRAALVRRKR